MNIESSYFKINNGFIVSNKLTNADGICLFKNFKWTLAIVFLLFSSFLYAQNVKSDLTLAKDLLNQTAKTIQFIENEGQWDKSIRFGGTSKHGEIAIRNDEITFVTYDYNSELTDQPRPLQKWAIRLIGGTLNNEIVKGGEFDLKRNYFVGGDINRYQSSVKSYDELLIKNVYNGIDLRLYSKSDKELEFDWVVNPGADFTLINLNFIGTDGLSVENNGSLKISTRFEDIEMNIPESYQIENGQKIKKDFSFNRNEQGYISFTTKSQIDPSLPLIIDPELCWGIYFDDNVAGFDEYLYGIDYDIWGNLICVGKTNVALSSGYIPAANYGYDNSYNGGTDVVIYKISKNGKYVLKITYFGSTSNDHGYGICMSPDRSTLFVTGAVGGVMPVTLNSANSSLSFDSSFGGGTDGFVAIFDTALSVLKYSSYIGAAGGVNSSSQATEAVYSIVAYNNTDYVIGGDIAGTALPIVSPNYIVNAPDNTLSGAEIYIASFQNFNSLLFGTYVGGNGTESLHDLQLLSDSSIVFDGQSNNNTNFPALVNAAASKSAGADIDGIVGVIPKNGGSFSMLSKIGGTNTDNFHGMSIGLNDTIFLTGYTLSSNFPLGTGASASNRYNITYGGGTTNGDAILVKVPKTGKSSATDPYMATFIGGSADDMGSTLRSYTQYSLLVFGETQSTNFPTKDLEAGGPFFKSTNSGGWDIFFFTINPDLKTLYFSTYVGGTGNDYLGNTGVAEGSNQFRIISDSLIVVGTTTHSSSITPKTIGMGTAGARFGYTSPLFDTIKQNTGATDDSHIIFTWSIGRLFNYDFGDAPLSYGTARNQLSDSIRIGNNIDNEDTYPATPGKLANVDDNTGVPNDEDGISGSISIGRLDTVYSTPSIKVKNTTVNPAKLMGWIDFNGNGVFDASELVSKTVAIGDTSATLKWSSLNITSSTDTIYMRLRLTTDAAATTPPSPNTDAYNGEVEDYMVLLTCPSISVSVSPLAPYINSGDSVNLTASSAGLGLTYQWYYNNSPISGANGTTYYAKLSGNYQVKISYAGVCYNYSNTVALQYLPTINVSKNPVCNGDSSALSVSTSVSNPGFQWKFNGSNISGATSATYTAKLNGNYSVALSSNAVLLGTTKSISLVVNPIPSISLGTPASVCSGINSTTLSYSAATGNQYRIDWNNAANAAGLTDVSATPVISSPITLNNIPSASATYNGLFYIKDSVTGCESNGYVLSLTVNPNLTASVSINATSTSVCGSSSITFTATPVNGGAAPSYQWKLNGANAGTNSNSYTLTTPNPGDSVYVILTSNASPCLLNATASSNGIQLSNSTVTPAVSVAASATNVCAGTNVTFTATPTNGGATPSYQWKLNGVNVGSNSSTYSSTTLSNNDSVKMVMTSSASCVSSSTAVSNTVAMTVNTNLTPAVSIGASATTVCAGTNVTFTATPTNGGATPSYQWKLNGANIGSNSSTYSSTTFANNDSVKVVLTSSAGCVTTPSATSNSVTLTVNPNLTASVSINATSTSVCGSSSITFTATPVNGGAAPSYQWKLNGANAGTNSNSYTLTTPNPGDSVYVILTSNASPCLLNATASSNGIQLSNSTVTPAVSVGASATTVCAGTNVTFTATPTNGGATPSYQWKLNGVNVGSNSSTYSSTTLSNNDSVKVVMTSSASCVSSSTAVSNTVAMTVNTNLTPAVSIGASATTVCAGTNVTFTATPTNGGATPSYQWKLNGANIGSNSSTYSSTTFANNDSVKVILTSSAGCVTTPSAISNSVTLTVNPNLTASVSINATSTSVCGSSSITFTATPVNGGAAPSYQWKLNGANAGTNSNSYTLTTPNPGDSVYVILTSNASPCLLNATASSNGIQLSNSTVTPAVSVGASATTVCAGTNVTFTATPTNGGATPSYQWKLNGVNVGSNSSTYSSTTLSNNDSVSVILTSNAGCLTTVTALSNDVIMTVNTNLTPAVNIGASLTTICAGTTVTFTATPTNGGSSPFYQWKINGINVGVNSSIFSSTTLSNNDSVKVVMTSSAECVTAANALSNIIGITVNTNLTPAVSIATTSTTVCSGTNAIFTATPINGGTLPSYQWKVNGINVGANSSTYSSTTFSNNDSVKVILTSNATCLTIATISSSNTVMTIHPLTSISSQPIDETVCAGNNLSFTISAVGASISYQWQIKSGSIWNSISGAVSTNLNLNTVASTSNGNLYRCAVSGTCGTINSDSVLLTVNTVPSISTQPLSVTKCEGFAATFTVSASGTGSITYLWKKNGNAISGATSSSLSVSSVALSDSGNYTVDVTNGCGTTTSATATLHINPKLISSVYLSATSTSVCGSSPITFTANVTNGGTAPSYHWKLNGSNAGTNSSTFTLSSPISGDSIYVIAISNASPCLQNDTSYSNGIKLDSSSVTPSVSISTTSTSVCAGNTVLFNASGLNTGASPVYQWKINGASAGTNSSSFTAASLTNTDTVKVIMTSNAGCLTTATATSNILVLRVNPITAISSQPIDRTVCAGSNTSFNISANGISLSYQWQVKSSGTWNNTSGGTSDTLDLFAIPNYNNGNYYRCSVTGTCGILISDSVLLTVNPVTSISGQPVATSVCEGNTTSFAVSASGSLLTYQWQIKSAGTWNNIASASSDSLYLSSVSASANGNYYRCIVNGSCGALTSDSSSLTVNTLPSITTQPIASSVCAGNNASFNIAASGSLLNYQWQLKSAGIWNNIAGATSDSLYLNSAGISADSNYYRCVVNGICGTIHSDSVLLRVKPNTAIGTQPVASTICSGSNTSFFVSATGTAITYQWQLKSAGTWNNIAGRLSDSLQLNSMNASASGSYYRCVVNGSCGVLNSDSALLIVNTIPSIITQPSALTQCEGTPATFTVTSTGINTYAWKKNGTAISGANSSSYFISGISLSDSGNYAVAISNGCGITYSSYVKLTVNPLLITSVNLSASSTSLCSNDTIIYTATAVNGGTTPAYQWKLNGISVGINSSTYILDSAKAGDSVYVILTSNASPCLQNIFANSNGIKLSNSIVTPSVSISTNGTSVCAGSVKVFTASGNNSGITPGYQWKINNVNEGTNSSTFSTSALSDNDTVEVIMTSSIPASCVTSSTAMNSVVIRVNNIPAINLQPVSTSVISGNDATFTISTSGTTNYQWQQSTNGGITFSDINNGALYTGYASDSLLILNTTGLGQTRYRIYAGNSCGGIYSDTVILNVNIRPIVKNDTSFIAMNKLMRINVMKNDTDPDGILSSPVIVANPLHGTASTDSIGNIVYQPNSNYYGNDTIMYKACDNGTPVACDSAYVFIKINAAPHVNNDTVNVDENNILTFNPEANDVDPDGILSIPVIICQPNHGSAIVNANGTIRYTPSPNYKGFDTIRYRVCDNGIPVICDSAMVFIKVDTVNYPPVAVNDTVSTPRDIVVTFNPLANDYDIDGTLNNPVIITSPHHGTATVNSNGTITYTPSSGYTGQDTLRYRVCDNGKPVLSDSAFVFINVDPVNHPPVAVNDTISTTRNTAVTFNPLTNDYDIDGTLSTPLIIHSPSHGTAIINSNGNILYTPSINYAGTDTLYYRVCDNGTPVLCDSAFVFIFINGDIVNHPPVAVNDTVSTKRNTTVTFNPRVNDYDVDGTLNDPVIIRSADHGTAIANSDGTITYTPALNYTGSDTMRYRVCDNGTPSLCDSAYIFINIDAANRPPVANDTTYHITNNVQFAGNLNTLVSDPDNNIDPNSFIVITTTQSGTVNLQANGYFTYTPSKLNTGTAYFVYRVCDLGYQVLCDTGIVYFIINNENKILRAVNDSFTVEENTEITFDVRTNDIDSGGTLANPIVIVQPHSGSVLLNSNGTITYSPQTDFVGSDLFIYRIYDNGNSSLCDSALVKINVTRSPDNALKIPEGFSPNGDGINDLFVIKNISKYPDNKLTVINRWGVVVYQKESYNNDWGGKANQGTVMDGTLPSGTYFYLFEIGGAEKAVFNGYVYITK